LNDYANDYCVICGETGGETYIDQLVTKVQSTQGVIEKKYTKCRRTTIDTGPVVESCDDYSVIQSPEDANDSDGSLSD
jgi:hypothetical protein